LGLTRSQTKTANSICITCWQRQINKASFICSLHLLLPDDRYKNGVK